MPGPITLDFNDLARLADAAPEGKSIIVKDGGFRSVGKLGAFFASKTECRLAAQTFMEGIKAKYGDAVAYTLAPELRALKASGKPLSAHKAKDLLRQAKELSRGLTQVNADMAEKFIKGSGIPGDPRTLDAAFADYCRENRLDPLNEQALKKDIGDAVLMMAKTSGHMMSFAEMCDAVRGWNTTPGIIIAREASDRLNELADAHGLDAGQKAMLEERAFMAAGFSSQGGRPTARQVADALQNDLSVACCLYTCGAPTINRAALRNAMDVAAATPHLKDTISLVYQLGEGSGPDFMLCLQNMDAIRALQPEGIPTRETIWQACFGEPLPAGLSGVSQRDFKDHMYMKIDLLFNKATGADPRKTANGITMLASGIKLEKAMAAMHGPVALSQDDFVGTPQLSSLQRLPSLEEAEIQAAKDILRRGSEPIGAYDPVITFGRTGQDAETVRIHDLTGVDEKGKTAYENGNPSPVSHSLVEKARAFCSSEAQLRQVVNGMGQGATILMSMTSLATGVPSGEHSPIDIDVRLQEDGSVTMHYRTAAAYPLDADYTYTIAPDGRSSMTSLRMQARPAGD
ncbi:MAG: hypothetical protein J5855_01475 [Mailhella sp.]|nr:hypothetical protein [Mailhella sp.]